METQESVNRKHVASMSNMSLMQQIVLECCQATLYISSYGSGGGGVAVLLPGFAIN